LLKTTNANEVAGMGGEGQNFAAHLGLGIEGDGEGGVHPGNEHGGQEQTTTNGQGAQVDVRCEPTEPIVGPAKQMEEN
jgi:hypothetical protein